MREYLSCIICDDPLVYHMQEKIEYVYSNFHDGCSYHMCKNCSDSIDHGEKME